MREKLVKLIKSNLYANTPYSLADHLIANGVVISKKRNNDSAMDTRDGEAAGMLLQCVCNR